MMPFQPVKKQKKDIGHILLQLERSKYERIKATAKEHNLSLKEFVRQAIDYAVEHLPPRKNE